MTNALVLAIGIDFVSVAAYASLYLFRNTWWDVIWFVAFVPVASIGTGTLRIRDLARGGTRKQAMIAILLLMPPLWVAMKVIHGVVH